MVLLAAVALAGTLPWNGRPLPFRASELRVLMCARTMAEGGDWLVPVYEREERINKPPLMYWVVAGLFRVQGGTESLSLARGVNAVFGALLVAAVYGCGRFWVGRRRARMAALVTATGYLFLRFARLCETDVALTFLTTLSCFALWQAAVCRGWSWWWLAGLFSGLGFLFKGPAAAVLPLAALAAGYVTGAVRGWRRGATGILPVAVTFAAVVLPWYLYLLCGRSAGAAGKDIGYEMAALLRESPHHGPPVYYLYMLPLLMLPWGVFLPGGVLAAWRKRRHRGFRFVLGWLFSAMAVMTMVRSKQSHYAMLLLPPAALLTGTFLLAAARNRRPVRYRATRWVLQLLRWLAAAMGVAGAAAPWFAEGVTWSAALSWGVPLAAVAVAAPWLFRKEPVRRDIAVLAAAAVWVAAAYGSVFHEIGEPAEMFRDCASEAKGRIGPETRVFLTGRQAMPSEFYLHHFIYRADDLSQAWEHAGTGDLVIVSLDREHRRVLTMEPPAGPVFRRRQGEYELRLYVK